jgi:putative oxidoreductase
MLKAVLSPFSDKLYAALRVVSGLMFAFHGMQKILGILWTMPYPRPELWSQMWFGGLIELVGGVAIAIGLFTRCAAFVASGTMAVAYFQFHWKFQGGSMVFPGINQGELAALYCWLFLFIAAKGAGPWSVDAKCEKPKA